MVKKKLTKVYAVVYENQKQYKKVEYKIKRQYKKEKENPGCDIRNKKKEKRIKKIQRKLVKEKK